MLVVIITISAYHIETGPGHWQKSNRLPCYPVFMNANAKFTNLIREVKNSHQVEFSHTTLGDHQFASRHETMHGHPLVTKKSFEATDS